MYPSFSPSISQVDSLKSVRSGSSSIHAPLLFTSPMDAGIPPDPGKALMTDVDLDGQVILGQSGQFQLPSVEGEKGEIDVGGGQAAQLSFSRGTTVPTATHLPVDAPPVTQLSPSMITTLPNFPSQISQPVSTVESRSRSESSSSFASVASTSSGPTYEYTSAVASAAATTSYRSSLTVVTIVNSASFSVSLSSLISTTTSPYSPSTPQSSKYSSASMPTPSQLAISSNRLSSFTTSTSIMPSGSSRAVSSSSSRISSHAVISSSSLPVNSTSSVASSVSRSTPLISTVTSASMASGSLFLTSSAIASATSVRNASDTAVAAAPAKLSNLNVHHPPFYVGIALGVIGVIVIIAVLIAWCFHLRRRAKRRRELNTVVPWARSHDEEDGGLAATRHSLGNSAMNLDGGFEHLAHVQAWSPHGDRDVGEPRRVAEHPNDSMYSLRDHSIPGHGLFSDESLPSSFRSSTPLRPRNTLRQLPSHLIDEDLAARAIQEDSSPYGPYSGRPVGLRDTGLAGHNPYIVAPNNLGSRYDAEERPFVQAHRSLVARLRKIGIAEDAEPAWDRLPTPGSVQSREDTEPWAASFRNSLANVISAVTGGGQSSAGAPSPTKVDGLTTAPTKHTRRSFLGMFAQPLPVSRDGSSESSRSKVQWTLEEKADGVGVVHFLPALEKEEIRKPTRRPPMFAAPSLSFGHGDNICIYDERSSDSQSESTRRRQVPLVASSAPQKAVIRPDGSFRWQDSVDSSRMTSLSRGSSVYSSASDTASKPGAPRLPQISSLTKIQSDRSPGYQSDESDSVVIAPSQSP